MSRSLSARDIAMIAMGVALTAVCSWISIPRFFDSYKTGKLARSPTGL